MTGGYSSSPSADGVSVPLLSSQHCFPSFIRFRFGASIIFFPRTSVSFSASRRGGRRCVGGLLSASQNYTPRKIPHLSHLAQAAPVVARLQPVGGDGVSFFLGNRVNSWRLRHPVFAELLKNNDISPSSEERGPAALCTIPMSSRLQEAPHALSLSLSSALEIISSSVALRF